MMATGIPRTNWRDASLCGNGNGLPKRRLDVTLEYEGKRPEGEILATPPASLKRLWPERNEEVAKNRIIFGENLRVLAALASDLGVREHVRLVYIDPPYATKSVFQSRNQTNAYADLLEGAHYLEFLRERLILLRELLARDGSIYVHIDDNMAFHVKIVMDEVFGRSNFRNWITRKKCNPKNYTRKTYGNVADFILFYTKSNDYVWHRPVEPWTQLRASKEYQYGEPGTGRCFKKVPVHAPGVRNGETGKPWRGMNPPPGKHWQYPPRVLDEMDARGEIYWSPNGNPRRKIYLDRSDGVPVQDIWMGFRDAHNQNIHVTGYPTEKNPLLLQRIIEASSDQGDVVLDCFSGSGTTLDVAHQLGRRWIGIDNSPEAIKTTLSRFAKGLQPMGDFVKKTGKAEELEKDEPTLPIFDLFQQPCPSKSKNVMHNPIRDFTLYAEKPYDGSLSEVVAEWERSSACGIQCPPSR
jgi:adenine-specific DNA-methyltransferase